jgi:drug/metabolite transporter (DMT)-like permease
MVTLSTLALSLAAMGSWTVFALAINHGLENISPIFAALIVYIVATITTLFISLWRETIVIPSTSTLFTLMTAGVSLAGGAIFYYIALEGEEVGVVTPIVGLNGVAAALAAVLLFSESMGLQKFAGLIAAAIAIILIGTA